MPVGHLKFEFHCFSAPKFVVGLFLGGFFWLGAI
jgi:hypothetical protein